MKTADIPKAIHKARRVKRPLFIWGPPGVGKSWAVRAYTEEHGLAFRDWRVALAEPTEIKGFPVPDMKRRVMEYLIDEILPPMDSTEEGILFLDELSAAPSNVQAALYQLTLDRKIGKYVLPEGWYIVAAGNEAKHRAVTNRMPSALANRFIHVFVNAEFDGWRKWAFDNGVNDHVIAYLSLRPDALHDFDPATNPLAFPTNRSWVTLSDLYTDEDPIDAEVMQELLVGTVGEGRASEFIGFVQLIDQLPDLDDIERDPIKTKVPEQPNARYAITAALAARVAKKNYEQIFKYIARMPVDFQVLFNRAALRKDEECAETRTFQKWSIENDTVLT